MEMVQRMVVKIVMKRMMKITRIQRMRIQRMRMRMGDDDDKGNDGVIMVTVK